MAFKTIEGDAVSTEQANEFFNDEVSVSLFSELGKSDEQEKPEHTTGIPEIKLENEEEEEIENVVVSATTSVETPSATTAAAPVIKKEAKLPTDWQKALEEEFKSENPTLIGWYDDKDNLVLPKNFDELKQLIKENKEFSIEESKKKWEEDNTSTLSPQIKSIMDYAKNGGKDVNSLLQSWATVESISGLDPSDPNEAENLVRFDLENKGLDKADIDEQIEFFKTTNKLVSKATDLKPKLELAERERISKTEIEQKERLKELQAKRIEYQTNMSKAVESTFTDKNIASTIKSSIFDTTYESSFRPGLKITGFQKSLEDLQLDPKKNDHFAEVALLASDREKFFEIFGNKVKKEVTADTVRKLKFSKNTNYSTEEETEKEGSVKLKGFRAPWKS